MQVWEVHLIFHCKSRGWGVGCERSSWLWIEIRKKTIRIGRGLWPRKKIIMISKRFVTKEITTKKKIITTKRGLCNHKKIITTWPRKKSSRPWKNINMIGKRFMTKKLPWLKRGPWTSPLYISWICNSKFEKRLKRRGERQEDKEIQTNFRKVWRKVMHFKLEDNKR